MNQPEFSKIKPRTVIIDHDGYPEDIVAMIMLLNMQNVNVIGIIVTPADCYITDAYEITLKLLNIMGKKIPVAIGKIESHNQFPDATRIPCIQINHLPMLIIQKMDTGLLDARPGHQFLLDTIKHSKEKVTVFLSGPPINLTTAIQMDPSIGNNIEEVVWAAGAINGPGNVQRFASDGSAEWNIHWNAKSSALMFKSKLNISLFPLEITKKGLIDMDLLKRTSVEWANCNIANLVGQMLAMICPICEFSPEFYLRNSLTCSYLGTDGIAKFTQMKLDVLQNAPREGKLVKSDSTEAVLVNVADDINVEKFQKYFVNSLKINGTFSN